MPQPKIFLLAAVSAPMFASMLALALVGSPPTVTTAQAASPLIVNVAQAATPGAVT